jgi:hypothetical protein
MYPEHIAVEKITHMDRCETDDLPFQQQQLQQQHSHESTANGADVSPQVRKGPVPLKHRCS